MQIYQQGVMHAAIKKICQTLEIYDHMLSNIQKFTVSMQNKLRLKTDLVDAYL